MFNIGFTELLILGTIALLVVGPEQLPDLARKISKLINELRRAKDEILEPVNELKSEALNAVEKARREFEEQMQKEMGDLDSTAKIDISLESKSKKDSDEHG